MLRFVRNDAHRFLGGSHGLPRFTKNENASHLRSRRIRDPALFEGATNDPSLSTLF